MEVGVKMRNEAEIFILKPLDVGFGIEKIQITDYNIPQLDRIEKKMDRILELLEDKKLSNSVSVDSKKVPWSYYTPGDIARHYGGSKDN